jgi:hypothetical protein
MDWCKQHGLAPANAEVWSRAEAAWIAMNHTDEFVNQEINVYLKLRVNPL